MLIAFWLFISAYGLPGEEPAPFKLAAKAMVDRRGGASDAFQVSDGLILTIDSKSHPMLWRLSQSAELEFRSELKIDWFCWHCSYAPAKRLLALPSSDSRRILLFSADASFQKRGAIDVVAETATAPTLAFALTPSGKIAAAANYSTRTIDVFDTSSLGKKKSIKAEGYISYLRFVDEDMILAVNDRGVVTIWEDPSCRARKLVREKLPRDALPVMDFGYTGDRVSVYYQLEHGLKFGSLQASLRSAKVSPSLRTFPIELERKIYLGRLSPRMDYLVLCTYDNQAMVYDLISSSVVQRFRLEDVGSSVLFLDNGDRFIVWCMRGYAYSFTRK